MLSKVTNFCLIGDVIGRPGRGVLEQGLLRIRQDYPVDVVVVNGENLAGGFGITKKTYNSLVSRLGIDVITSGNHWHDKPEVDDILKLEDSRLVVPLNVKGARSEPGFGFRVFQTQAGISYVVINVVGRVFMNQEVISPFEAMEQILQNPVVQKIPIRLVDMHAEATSEKQGVGFYFASMCSVIYGTHSHVPTCDERIIEDHAGFITDIGMCGAYDSVIGMKKSHAIERMIKGVRNKLEPAKKEGWICALLCAVNEQGVCTNIQRIQIRL